jgi:7,8-dihydropterin-6-yl-methyl-4-(beta-D-ribofuranosyl)aminobenzene 5'-phosphate synthase
MEQTTVTILAENTAAGPAGLIGEHGFAALIERGETAVLFDTGQSISLARNAKVLGKDLAKVDTVVLSHGHYDHTGGLPDVLFATRGVEVIAHPDVFAPKYAVSTGRNGHTRRFIGIKHNRAYLEHNGGARFTFLRAYTEIRPGMFFSGEVERKTVFEEPDTHLKVEQQGRMVTDPLRDDASLLVETASGPVVICGCAHAGVVNVLHHFRAHSGHETFHGVIGGTHLGYAPSDSDRLQRTMETFEHYGLVLIGVSHCTGQRAAAICHHRFEKRFAFASVGWSHVF